ncbi:hypothetical protein [Streptomyces sp. NPDC004042]|uniref:hypothetical protein n=1 Tax=Streptomyces sp. NPDC004042 TaxID=3154451 RepID=UPI0033B3E9CB
MRRRLRVLRSALGLPERSPVELVALLHESLLRTEPGFLLLNAEEGCAYRLLDPLPRPALREVVLMNQGAPRRTGAPGELDLSSLVRPAEAFDRLGDQFQALRARQSRTALDRPATTTAAVTGRR